MTGLLKIVPAQQRSGTPKGLSCRWRSQDWQLLGLLCLICCLVFLPGLGQPGILNSSDAYYSEGAREMVESGNYLTPHLNYKPWFEKPILNYWLIAASYHILGTNEFAARLPSALSGMTLVILTFVLGRFFLSRRAAFLSALVLTASPLLLVVSRVSLTDGPLTALVSFSMMALLVVLNGGPRVFLWFAYVALGLSVLCKGPIGVVLAGGAIVVYLAATQRTLTSAIKSILELKPLLGLLVIVLVAAPWFVAEHFATGGAFTSEFFVRQNLGRAAGSLSTHHDPGTWWFYVPYLIGGFFPWCFMFLAMPQFLRRIWLGRHETLLPTRLLVYAVGWLCVVLALFSVLPTKLGTYILPAFPAMAYVVGAYLDVLARSRKVGFLSGVVLGLLSSGAGALVVLPLSHKIPETFLPLALGTTVLLLLGFSLSFWLFQTRRMPKAVFTLVGSVIVGCGIFVPLGINVYYVTSQEGYRELVELAGAAEAKLATFAVSSAPAAFYLHRQIPELSGSRSLTTFLSTHNSKHWLLLKTKALEKQGCIWQRSQLLANRGKWCLISLDGER